MRAVAYSGEVAPEERVAVRVRLDVVLPGVPAVVAGTVPTRVVVQGDAVAGASVDAAATDGAQGASA